MSVYGAASLEAGVSESFIQKCANMFLVDDISRGSSDQIKEFCVSETAQVLTEKSVLKKGTLMRLSKSDDEKRRVKLVAYQLAKDSKDPLWEKLKLNRVKEKALIKDIMKKYGRRAEKIAKIAQKEYIKTASKMK